MKKLLALVCCMFLLATTSKAQYVNIPDSNFRSYLKFEYYQCMDTQGRLDTTCSRIVNDTVIDLTSPLVYGIADLTTLKYFKNLKYLNIFEQQIDSIHFLPSKLKSFKIYQDSMSYLKEFPDSLEYLDINLNYSKLNKLPPIPTSVKVLAISGCNLKIFPALPPNLLYLICSGDSLSKLPSIPANLILLNCSNNQLTNLPQLNNNLEKLDISRNYFTNVPITINDNLKDLDIGANLLSFVNNLPKKLEKLNAIDANAFGHKLCFGYLPETLLEFNSIYTSYDCLPNHPKNCKFYYNYGLSDPMPICNPTNNQERCQAYPVIESFVYIDKNLNLKYDITEKVKQNLKLLLNNNDSYTNTQGVAYMNADSIGTYTITASPPPFYNAVPPSYTHYFTSYDTLVIDTFTLQATVLKDSISIKLTPTNWAARAGRSYPYLVSYENVGTTVLSNAAISLNYSNSLLNYDSSSVSGVTNIGSSLSLSIGNARANG